MLEKMLEMPLDFKEIKHECSFADAEAPMLWPPDVKSMLIRKDPDAGKD